MQSQERKRVIMVTGASAGVGRAVVREFASQGASIGLIARGLERLQDTKNEVEAAGGRALLLPADVADPAQVENAAARLEAEFGPLDVWVNNAMTTIYAPLTEMTPEEFKRATEVTYLGCVYGTMAALKGMKERNHGTIVQVGSALAYRSIPLQSPYCGAKHAIVGFTDSLRSELIHDRSNVHLTVVHLPALNTPQFSWCRTRLTRHPQPVPPIFQPEVAARAIVLASSQRRREIWVGAPTYQAILGQRIAPGLADHVLAATAYEAQQSNHALAKDRPDNLFEPAPGSTWAAHGIFDDQAKSFTWTDKLTLHPFAAGLAVGVGFIAAGLASFRLKRRLTHGANQA